MVTEAMQTHHRLFSRLSESSKGFDSKSSFVHLHGNFEKNYDDSRTDALNYIKPLMIIHFYEFLWLSLTLKSS